jgi:hypothetical protein
MAIAGVTIVGIAIAAVCSALLLYYRNAPSVKHASARFCQVTILGDILCLVSVLLMSGEAGKGRICGIETWILAIGFNLVMGSLAVKMW